MKRHGDGRHAKAPWYHSIARSMRLLTVLTARLTSAPSRCGPPALPVDRPIPVPTDGAPVRSSNVRSPSGTCPAQDDRMWRADGTRPGAGGAGDCGRRRDHGRDLSRRPPSAARSTDRADASTTEIRRAPSGHDDRSGRTQLGCGRGGSSGEAGAALGAAGLEHGASGAGAHAGTESVLLRTTMLIGLERSLHVASSWEIRTGSAAGRR